MSTPDMPPPPSAPHPSTPSPAAGPVAERDRIEGLDVVRGLAVLGILVMNIVEFGLPMRAYTNPAWAGGHEGADLWAWLTQMTLFDGRMRGLFSMLFGAGMVLLSQRFARAGRGGSAADVLLRRCLWLIPIGIVHRFFLQWTGDILYMYGLLGALVVAFRGARPRTQLVLGAVLGLMFVPMNLRGHAQAVEQRAAAAVAQQLLDADPAAELSPEQQDAHDRWQRRVEMVPPKPETLQQEIDAIHGGWVSQFRHRWDHNHAFQHAYIYNYFVFDVVGMMLIGMGLMQLGFFAGAMSTRAYLLFAAGGAAAAAWSYWLASWRAEGGFAATMLDHTLWSETTYFWTRLFGGLGQAALLLLCVRAGALRLLTRPLAAVGRMAFTNYVLQTVLCSLLFFGYGLSWYGELSRSQLMWVVLAVSAVQIAFSMLWLRAFRFGPLEWCWRALTYWRRPAMRRRAPDTNVVPA